MDKGIKKLFKEVFIMGLIIAVIIAALAIYTSRNKASDNKDNNSVSESENYAQVSQTDGEYCVYLSENDTADVSNEK